MNWFDIVLLIVLAASVLAGFRAGLTRVIIHLVATVVGLLAAFWCYRLVGAKLVPGLTTNLVLANLLGFAIVFVGVMLIGSLLSALAARIFRWIGLSWFDHLLGGVAGVVRGALIIVVMTEALVAFSPDAPTYLEHSRILPYVDRFGGWLVDIAPQQLKQDFDEQMDHIKDFWRNPDQHRHSDRPSQA